MFPVVEVPQTVQRQMRPYRDLFRRSEGFEYVSRYVTGLVGQSEQDLAGDLCRSGVGGEETESAGDA